MGLWLEKSGQAWKTSVALKAAYLVWPSIGLCLVAQQARLGVMLLASSAFLLSAGVANVVLPLTIRCRVCGLQLETSSYARQMQRGARLAWLRALERCPVCSDDGLATMQSLQAWRQSGQAGEAAYWSGSRVALAIACVALLGILMAALLRYRVTL